MERKLPTLAELNADKDKAFKNDALNKILNTPPPQNWIKEHPFIKNVKYIPIERIEFLLTKIFQQWRVEVLSYSQLFNSVAVHVRLHYLNPVTHEWSFHDGLGAVGIQTDAGKQASDMTAIKQDAVMKALPAAESYAVKDAAEKLGILFGKNLNRKETIPFQMTYQQPDKESERLEILIKEAKTVQELLKYKEHLKPEQLNLFNEKLQTLKDGKNTI